MNLLTFFLLFFDRNSLSFGKTEALGVNEGATQDLGKGHLGQRNFDEVEAIWEPNMWGTKDHEGSEHILENGPESRGFSITFKVQKVLTKNPGSEELLSFIVVLPNLISGWNFLDLEINLTLCLGRQKKNKLK